MDWNAFDYWKFLAGLGIFMYGMFLLEEAVKQLSGKTFKTFIRKSTTGKVRSIGTGLVATSVLQSSSAVTLMTITFVGAGMMTMQNAIGVVLGTNLGTTATSWLVATVGFKINIEGLFLPLIGTGGLGLIFLSKSPRYNGISRLLVGLGFLFMGLEYMKVSVEGFASGFDLSTLPHYGTWFYVVIGIILTSIMQSSSASIAVILTALHTGLMTFPEGAAMVIGANIGTTSTVMLGSLGAIPIKKQVALSHLIFNFFTGIVALLFLPLLSKLVVMMISPEEETVLAVTLFHTLFNLLGVMLFLPFIGILVRFLQKIYPEKKDSKIHFINQVSTDLPEAAVMAVKKESLRVFENTLKLIFRLLHLEKSKEKKGLFASLFSNDKKEQSALELFEEIQQTNQTILVFASKIPIDNLEELDKKELNQATQMTLVTSQITKTLMSIQMELEELTQSEQITVDLVLNQIRNVTKEHLIYLKELIAQPISRDAHEQIQNKIKHDYKGIVGSITEQLKLKNIEEKEASLLLMINGFITQTIRQLFRTLERNL
jgi:phosphate:Na+ symporter